MINKIIIIWKVRSVGYNWYEKSIIIPVYFYLNFDHKNEKIREFSNIHYNGDFLCIIVYICIFALLQQIYTIIDGMFFCIFRFFPGSQFFEIKLDPILVKNNREFTIVFFKVNPKAWLIGDFCD